MLIIFIHLQILIHKFSTISLTFANIQEILNNLVNETEKFDSVAWQLIKININMHNKYHKTFGDTECR